MSEPMTMDDIRSRVESLRRECQSAKLPATDIVRRLLRDDVSLGWPMAIEAADEIITLRNLLEQAEQIAARGWKEFIRGI